MPSEEMVKNAGAALKHVLELRSGENFLVITDAQTRQVADCFVEAARRLGAKPNLYIIDEGKRPLLAVPEDLAALIPDSDVAVTCFMGLPEETPFRIELIHSLMRVVRRLGHAPGITEAMLAGGPMAIDYEALEREAESTIKRFEGATVVHLTGPAGTDIVLDITDRTFSTDIFIEDGHWGNLPVGEIWCAPKEDGANGIFVCDGSIGDLGPVPAPVVLHIEAGRLKKVECAVEDFRKRVEEVLEVDEQARVIGEFGIGLNPGARITGNLLEDEKARTTVHIAFGNNLDMPGGRNSSKTHRDFLMRDATVIVTYADGRRDMVMKDGLLLAAAGSEKRGVVKYRHVLVAVDFSEASREALRVAHSIADLCGARLTVCHVMPRPVAVSPLFPHYVAMPDAEAIRLEEERTLSGLLTFLEQETGRGSRDAELLVASGQPAAELLRIAEERGVDLIVVASRGQSRIARMVLGSVAESVARHAHCHVLVTR